MPEPRTRHSESRRPSAEPSDMIRRPTCLFMARVGDESLFRLIEFYSEDVAALTTIGFDVHVARNNRMAIRQPRPDLAYCWWHSTALPTVIAMRFRRVPVVTIGAFHFQDTNDIGFRSRLRNFVGRLTARLSTMNLAISKFEERDLAFLPPARRVAVPLSIDTDFYTPSRATAVPARAVTVGQINPSSLARKGIDLAIRAVPIVRRTMPNFELDVVGPITAGGQVVLDHLLGSIDSSGVIIHGEVTRERKLELLQASSLYIQMSTFEGFGLAAAEAMACGVPVLHSGAGALREVVGEGGAEARRTEADLSRMIVELLTDGSAHARRSSAARRQAHTFSRAARSDRLAALIIPLVRPSAHASES